MLRKGSLILTNEDIEDDYFGIIPKGTKCKLIFIGNRISSKGLEYLIMADAFSYIKTIGASEDEVKLNSEKYYYQKYIEKIFTELK